MRFGLRGTGLGVVAVRAGDILGTKGQFSRDLPCVGTLARAQMRLTFTVYISLVGLSVSTFGSLSSSNATAHLVVCQTQSLQLAIWWPAELNRHSDHRLVEHRSVLSGLVLVVWVLQQ